MRARDAAEQLKALANDFRDLISVIVLRIKFFLAYKELIKICIANPLPGNANSHTFCHCCEIIKFISSKQFSSNQSLPPHSRQFACEFRVQIIFFSAVIEIIVNLQF